jgi:hypothetical protein
MANPDYDKMMVHLFNEMRQSLAFGNHLTLVDNIAFLAVRLRAARHPDPVYPGFRILIWCGAAGVQISLRQRGHGATGNSVRRHVAYNAPDIEGDVMPIVREFVTAERARLSQFRHLPPNPGSASNP